MVSLLHCSYTLRNAEYRLCLERNLDMHEGNTETQISENSKFNIQGLLLDSASVIKLSGEHEFSSQCEKCTDHSSENIDIQSLGEMSPEAQQYVLHLQSRLSSAKKVFSSFKGSLFVGYEIRVCGLEFVEFHDSSNHYRIVSQVGDCWCLLHFPLMFYRLLDF